LTAPNLALQDSPNSAEGYSSIGSSVSTKGDP
jgi:hypothetical protein